MKAIAITPGKGNARLINMDEPSVNFPDEVKLKVLEVGVCGTDREEVEGGRADAPAGEDVLVIGHEMLGKVVETGKAVKKVKPGDYALFTVRRPCNECDPCNNGRNDMCYTGKYTERGIKEYHGFQSEYVVDREEFLIPIPPGIADLAVLTEPMSVVEKAIDEALRIQGKRLPGIDISSWLEGKKALVAGIGPIGLLASFLLKLRGARIFGLDIVEESSPRPALLREIGGEYINGTEIKTVNIDDNFGNMDFIFEATGIAKLGFQLMDALGINGIYVLTGIPAGERPVTILGNELMRNMVLMNHAMLGSVNASVDHYMKAKEDLEKMKARWPEIIYKMITRRIHYTNFEDVIGVHTANDIKTVIEWK